VYSVISNKQQLTVDLREERSGVYFLKVKTEKGERTIKIMLDN
jgi:hypothetical protein